ncbi:MAG TPA: zinc-binding alcohol dehydrogenase family protein [Burkholderiaceae bacterium]
MKAAIVLQAGATPIYGDFPAPTPQAGQFLVDIRAAALSQLTRSRAAGSHYSSGSAYPFVAGVDGVGHVAGRRVYFVLPDAPYGSMAEQVAMVPERCVMLPDSIDDVSAAALANPGMSSWAALRHRAHLVAGETVLVNGATGSAGKLAVQIAKHLGARKVIATGRNKAALAELAALGADAVISLSQDAPALENAFKEQFSAGVDVVLDYVWGPSAETLLIAAAKAGKEGVPLRFVQIGAISGADVRLPGAVLRSSAITLMGSGIGSVSLAHLLRSIEQLLQAAQSAGLRIDTRSVPLAQVQQAWMDDGAPERTVFTM